MIKSQRRKAEETLAVWFHRQVLVKNWPFSLVTLSVRIDKQAWDFLECWPGTSPA